MQGLQFTTLMLTQDVRRLAHLGLGCGQVDTGAAVLWADVWGVGNGPEI